MGYLYGVRAAEHFWIAAGLLLGLASQCQGQERLRVRIYNPAKIGPHTLNAGTREAARILTTAGVDVVWDLGETGSPDLAVNIVRGDRQGVSVPQDVLGYALRDPISCADITILIDRIELLERAGIIHVPTMLGNALAHEIGHVILGTAEHSNSGIMTGLWGLAEYLKASQGQMKFSVSERSTIVERLSHRLYLQTGAVPPYN